MATTTIFTGKGFPSQPRPRRKDSWAAAWTIVALAMIVLTAGAYFIGYHNGSLKQASSPKQVSTSLVPTPPPPVQKTIDFKTDGVWQGEGASHPLARQLVADPSLAGYTGPNDQASILRFAEHEVAVRLRTAKLVGSGTETADAMLMRQLIAHPEAEGYTGSKNPASIREWATQEARTRAKNAGLMNYRVGKTKEVRVKTPGTIAFVFEKDQNGELQIVEYVIATGATTAVATSGPSTPNATTVNYVTDTGEKLLRMPLYTIDMANGIPHPTGAQGDLTPLQRKYLYVTD